MLTCEFKFDAIGTLYTLEKIETPAPLQSGSAWTTPGRRSCKGSAHQDDDSVLHWSVSAGATLDELYPSD